MQKIAFLGMGAMGKRMAFHLIGKDFELWVWNRSPAACDELVACGAIFAKTPAEAASEADIVISMLRDDEASNYVWLDSDIGALSTMKRSATAVECSTLSPSWVNLLASHCVVKDISFLDAPVVGSRHQAETRKLIFLVGGDQQVFESAIAVLRLMAGAVHYCGTSAAGAKLKLAVNALLGMQLAGLAEILAMLESSGLNLNRSMEVLTTTPVFSPALQVNGDAMVARQFEPLFPVELIEKDFGYLESFANTLDTKVPLCSATRDVLKRALSEGLGAQNMTSIASLYLSAIEN